MSIYTRFTADDIVEANPTEITTGLWSGDTGSLVSGSSYTYTTQRNSSGYYYLDVFDKDPATTELAEVQFAITYGHVDGGGAPTLAEEDTAKLPTKAIYSQYRNLLLDPSDTKFSFNGVESDHIYVINLQRARVRGQLDPGNWSLPLSGAAGAFTFIDDSGQTLGALTANSKAGRVFNVISGSLTGTSGSTADAIGWPSASATAPGFGLVYPDLGIIVLNPDAICPMVGFFTSGSSANLQATGSGTYQISGSAMTSTQIAPVYAVDKYTPGSWPFAPLTSSAVTNFNWNNQKSAYNHYGLYHSYLNAISRTDTKYEFDARSAETISSTHYFIRLRNKEYNYSNNPTFYNPDNGALIQASFRNDPRVYITTVGLYNDQNELLAVAKLSAPLRKSFDEEILLRVRLDF